MEDKNTLYGLICQFLGAGIVLGLIISDVFGKNNGYIIGLSGTLLLSIGSYIFNKKAKLAKKN